MPSATLNRPPIETEDTTIAEEVSPPIDLNRATRNEKIEAMLPLVRHIVSRMAIHLPSHLSKDDLIGAGVLGLVDAVDRYDASRGCSLKTFCSLRIRGAIIDELRRHDWVPRSVHRDAKHVREVREKLAQKLGREPNEAEIRKALGMNQEEYSTLMERVKPISTISMQEAVYGTETHDPLLYEEIVADVRAESGCDQLLSEEDKQILAAQLRALPRQQLQVLTLYYIEDLRLKEIAEILDLTESRVSQIHTLGLARLKMAFERARRS